MITEILLYYKSRSSCLILRSPALYRKSFIIPGRSFFIPSNGSQASLLPSSSPAHSSNISCLSIFFLIPRVNSTTWYSLSWCSYWRFNLADVCPWRPIAGYGKRCCAWVINVLPSIIFFSSGNRWGSPESLSLHLSIAIVIRAIFQRVHGPWRNHLSWCWWEKRFLCFVSHLGLCSSVWLASWYVLVHLHKSDLDKFQVELLNAFSGLSAFRS